jgi:hypothetical protein
MRQATSQECQKTAEKFFVRKKAEFFVLTDFGEAGIFKNGSKCFDKLSRKGRWFAPDRSAIAPSFLNAP